MGRAFCQASVARRGSGRKRFIRIAVTVFSAPASNSAGSAGKNQDQDPDFWQYSTMIEHLFCGMIENDVRL